MSRLLTYLCICLAPAMGFAADFTFSVAAEVTAEQQDEFSSYRLPTGPWADGQVETIWAEGALSRQAIRLSTGKTSTMEILAPLRDQLNAAGYDVLFECETRACGGFDFRFQTDVMPEPDMHVDLGDFRFLSAKEKATDKNPEYISLYVSRSGDAGYVQITRIGSKKPPAARTTLSTRAPAPALEGMVDGLENTGAVVLDDLQFKTGSSNLGDGPFTSLTELAAYLSGYPERRVVLVGHTDAQGALNKNVALSKKRAEAVAAYLVANLGVAADQVTANGVGYLSPRASNLTVKGRELNRRVEAILTNIK